MPNLNKRTCDAAKYTGTENGRCVVWDAALPGFGLRIYPGGKKTFVLSYRPAGSRTKRMMTIGTFGEYTLDQARAKAKKHMVSIREGGDPLHDRVTVEVSTFGQLLDRWLEEYAKLHRKSWKEDQRRIETHLRPKFGSWPVTKLSGSDLRRLHARIAQKAPVEANRVVELARAIYARAAKWELLPANFTNPGKLVERSQEHSRERWLTAKELMRLAAAINREDDPSVQAAIRLLLLTGCRKTELLRARWDRVDLERRRLLLEDTKTGAAKVVPLSAPAIDILNDLPRRLGSPYLFAGRFAGEPLHGLKRAWSRIRARAKLPDVTVHDLRRTTGSWLVQKGVPLRVIGDALGHQSMRSTEVYARIAADAPAAALDMLGEAMAGIMTTRKRAGAR